MRNDTDCLKPVPCYLHERSKSLYIPKPRNHVTPRQYVGHLSYTDQLEAYIRRYRRRPADIKYWPYGPYWPGQFEGLLLNTPRHLVVGLQDLEPLATGEFGHQLFANSPTTDTQVTQYLSKWRGVQVAYDADRSPRDFVPLPVPEGCCPTLMFESRFECGNLQQARRVGQFDYELILKPDLHTVRHTQWFYFRVTNSVPGVTYKLRIVNLLKKDSLYNHGMRPLLYSEQDAKEKQKGWVRTGHHISYTRNSSKIDNPLLEKGITYYSLEWQMQFSNSKDTYYLAHCYPYSFTDLKEDLELLMNSEERSKVTRREVMCETRAGNSCFLITVTNFDCKQEKQAVVVSARVHPGETQSSWMMKGLLDFITGPDPVAKELRNRFVFKMVPMVNPDGVIVGNYRCSLMARDLNRNYRHPRQDTFPTIWYIKNMVYELAKKYEIALYCDLHGHSRKPNVFMYGNHSSADLRLTTPHDQARSFISERLFPWVMSVKSPDKFHFGSCKFQIRRCKESTGRVVMWRQMRIYNSFTMEATFSGTVLDRDNCRHFNVHDFMELGSVLAQAILEYQSVRDDPIQHSRTVLALTQCLTEQVLNYKGVVGSLGSLVPLGSRTSSPGLVHQGTRVSVIKDTSRGQNDVSVATGKLQPGKQTMAENDERQTRTPAAVLSRDDLAQIAETLTSGRTLDDCVELLVHLNVQENLQESDSSDSDSDSEPEMRLTEPKTKKKRRKSKKQRNNDAEKRSESHEFRKKAEDDRAKSTSNHLPSLISMKVAGEAQRSSRGLPWFVSKYEGRHNGGLPCFTEERSLERAAKRLADHKVKQTEVTASQYSAHCVEENEVPSTDGSEYRLLLSDRVSHNTSARSNFSVKTGYIHADRYLQRLHLSVCKLRDRYLDPNPPSNDVRGHWKNAQTTPGHQNQRPGESIIIKDKHRQDTGPQFPMSARRNPYNQLDLAPSGSLLEPPFVQHSYVTAHPSWPASSAASSPPAATSGSRHRLLSTDIALLSTCGPSSVATNGNKLGPPFTVKTISTRPSAAVSLSSHLRSLSSTKQLYNSSAFKQREATAGSATSSENSNEDQESTIQHLAADFPTVWDSRSCLEFSGNVGCNDLESQNGNLEGNVIRTDKLNVGQLVSNLEQNLTGVMYPCQTFKHATASRMLR